VGEFQNLVRVVDTDGGQLRKMIQAILKLSKEKWDEAARHAMDAVHPDFRRRVWWVARQQRTPRASVAFGSHYERGALGGTSKGSACQAASAACIAPLPEDESL
jgi:hypothetical protein